MYWTRQWETWGQVSAQLPLCCVIVGKLPNLSGSQYCWQNKGPWISYTPFQVWGGLSVPQHMTPDHAGARERTLCSLHTQPLMGDVLSEFMSSHLHIWAMDL